MTVCISIIALPVVYAKRMRRIILSSLKCLAVPYVSTLSHTQQNFRHEILKMEKVVSFNLQILSVKFLILRRTQSGAKNVHKPSRQMSVIHVILFLNFQIFEKYSNIKFHENTFSMRQQAFFTIL